MADTRACTSCGRDLKHHCQHCNWQRCTNRICGVDLHDTGALERIARPHLTYCRTDDLRGRTQERNEGGLRRCVTVH